MQGPGTDDSDGRYHHGMDIYEEHAGMNGDGSHEHQNGSEDGDLAEEDVDDLLDDDLMDKISSSPSIDDGACVVMAN